MQKVIRMEIYKDNNRSKQKKINSCNGNINKIWKQAKNLFFKQKSNFPDKLIFNNTVYNGSKKVAEELNKFFVNKVQDKIKSIPKSTFDPIKHYKDKIKKPNNSFKINNINLNQLKEIFSKMNITKSTGFHGISMEMIKYIKKPNITTSIKSNQSNH